MLNCHGARKDQAWDVTQHPNRYFRQDWGVAALYGVGIPGNLETRPGRSLPTHSRHYTRHAKTENTDNRYLEDLATFCGKTQPRITHGYRYEHEAVAVWNYCEQPDLMPQPIS